MSICSPIPFRRPSTLSAAASSPPLEASTLQDLMQPEGAGAAQFTSSPPIRWEALSFWLKFLAKISDLICLVVPL